MNNPKCPYCGETMALHLRHGYFSYFCPSCYSEAPIRTTPEEALAAAMKRERAKGKWIFVLEGLLYTTYRCSHCGNYFVEHSDTLNAGRCDKKYCPNCGADMRKEANDE